MFIEFSDTLVNVDQIKYIRKSKECGKYFVRILCGEYSAHEEYANEPTMIKRFNDIATEIGYSSLNPSTYNKAVWAVPESKL